MDFREREKKAVTQAYEPIGKQQLCVTLGWSRARLDRRIASDPDFPVLRRGTQGGGWCFDLDAVRAHLAKKPQIRRPGRPSGGWPHRVLTPPESMASDVERARALQHEIEGLMKEWGSVMERIETRLRHNAALPASLLL